jgi:deoxycytidine triphosphate deaminase
MLSDVDVKKLVENGTISLSYNFLPNDTGNFVRTTRILKANSDETARNFFTEHLVRSRLALTLGPLVKPVSHARRIPRSKRYAGHNRVVDLRNCSDGWALLPGQSAVVCTNEHIRLPHDVMALIVGRVSSYNNGLVTGASYLDSGWDGIVKLIVVNTSQKAVRLYLGLEVARIFFEQTPNASLDTSSVGTQSIHYGMSWARILDDRIDPFPQSSAPPGVRVRLAFASTNDLLQRYAGVGLVALAAFGVLGAVRLYGELQTNLARANSVSQLSRQINLDEARAPVSGTTTITITPGSNQGQVAVPIPGNALYRGGSSSSFVALRNGPSNTILSSQVEQNNQGGVVLVLTARAMNIVAIKRSIIVTWVYLP